MVNLSKYERGVLWNLCLDGIKKLKKELKEDIDNADEKLLWDVVDNSIIQIREAQCIMEKINPHINPKTTGDKN